MATNKVQLAVNFRKNTNTRTTALGKYYAEVGRQKTLTTRGLAAHLKEHNCMVGRDAIVAVLVKLSECVPELVAQGVGVKLDGLGIFYPTIENKKGGASETQMLDSEFDPTSIIKGVHVRFLPESSELDNITSRQFLTRGVHLAPVPDPRRQCSIHEHREVRGAHGRRQVEARAGGAEPGRLPHGQCAQQRRRSAARRW